MWEKPCQCGWRRLSAPLGSRQRIPWELAPRAQPRARGLGVLRENKRTPIHDSCRGSTEFVLSRTRKCHYRPCVPAVKVWPRALARRAWAEPEEPRRRALGQSQPPPRPSSGRGFRGCKHRVPRDPAPGAAEPQHLGRARRREQREQRVPGRAGTPGRRCLEIWCPLVGPAPGPAGNLPVGRCVV